MKCIIDSFDEKSKKIIDNMDSVKKFKADLDERAEKVSNFKHNKKTIYKLLHPVSLIKNCAESVRINNIRSTYEKYYNSNVLMFITEETGDLQIDLYNAAYNEKPKQIDGYIKSIKLKK